MSYSFKPGFLLGAASAATQIEGGDSDHNWNDWYRQGRIHDGSDPARTTDHYTRWREDADLMAQMGLRIYRLGIEWARLCPTETTVDEAVVAHYREELLYLRGKGIAPLLTIHHFTNPMWFEKKGGFLKTENLHFFSEFVALVVRSFGDLVSEYITINEPNVYATESFLFGLWPPGLRSLSKTFTILSNMATCHIQAYTAIHTMRREMGYEDTKVSFANHVRVFDPENNKNPVHRLCSAVAERCFQTAITRAMCLGEFTWPVSSPQPLPKGEYIDFIAVNYYSRSTVSGFHEGVRKGVPLSDLGWEIYPEGIVRCCRMLYDILPRPIYITENGTCDNQDAFRCRFLYDHLKALTACPLPIERYYHWCFCDNFEWLEGESARFGLVHVNYKDQTRTVKQSGRFYSAMIREGGVTPALYDTYVKNQQYHY